MKKIILVTIPLLICFLAYSQSENKEYTFAFYNVENLFDTINDNSIHDEEFTPEGRKKWTTGRYQKKLIDISKVLDSFNSKNPSLVGFAEVENRSVLEDLIETDLLKDNNYKIVHEDSPDARGIDVALIYSANEIKYLNHKKIPVPLNTEYKVRDILYFKGILGHKDTLHIFVNHWKSRSGGVEKTESQRVQCAITLRTEIDSIINNNPSAKIIVLGDLNDTPINKSVKETLKADNSLNKNALYNLMLPYTKKGLGTHSYRGEWSVYDHIIVSNSLLKISSGYTVKGNEAFIFSADWITYESKDGIKSPNRTYGGPNYYGGYSDHYPVYIILSEE